MLVLCWRYADAMVTRTDAMLARADPMLTLCWRYAGPMQALNAAGAGLRWYGAWRGPTGCGSFAWAFAGQGVCAAAQCFTLGVRIKSLLHGAIWWGQHRVSLCQYPRGGPLLGRACAWPHSASRSGFVPSHTES